MNELKNLGLYLTLIGSLVFGKQASAQIVGTSKINPPKIKGNPALEYIADSIGDENGKASEREMGYLQCAFVQDSDEDGKLYFIQKGGEYQKEKEYPKEAPRIFHGIQNYKTQKIFSSFEQIFEYAGAKENINRRPFIREVAEVDTAGNITCHYFGKIKGKNYSRLYIKEQKDDFKANEQFFKDIMKLRKKYKK